MTIRDNRDYIRVLFYSHYTTITGWGVLLKYNSYGGLSRPKCFRLQEMNDTLSEGTIEAEEG